ncbi:2'-5'-oligoadenylate synthase 1-like [Pomacea canaliculata]|uniref:2'-5'-oligoadenylate synthase 1-like n=1 Tax=Pomacea canaliculata TaxID=400727 RepID=UPI000D7256E2|nr:2'-5'-oligoadenylate synthase 1-like [Pomacea canaliculata]XP_025115689.1 2'-5'-oligoadenylate synthase 1-like [Pomacea canaliculata]
MDEIFPDMRPGQSLDDYIEKSLRPTPQEFSRFHTAVDLFVRFLQKTFSDSTYSVAKVLKSGSLAKGTALRDSSDIDLVVFINGLTDIDDLMVAREALKRRMIAAAETYPSSLKTKKSTKFAAKFAFNNIELDVLPAFDALRSYSGKRRNIYSAISQHLLSSKKIGQEFSASLAPLQVAFIKTLRCSVKDYIRLMKQWKKVNDLTIPSYCLELLTVKVWRDMGGSKKRQRPASTFKYF